MISAKEANMLSKKDSRTTLEAFLKSIDQTITIRSERKETNCLYFISHSYTDSYEVADQCVEELKSNGYDVTREPAHRGIALSISWEFV
jgi:hypothetical protein